MRIVPELEDVAHKIHEIKPDIHVSVVKCDVMIEKDVQKVKNSIEKEAGGRLGVLVVQESP